MKNATRSCKNVNPAKVKEAAREFRILKSKLDEAIGERFDILPFCILVVGRNGRIVHKNALAQKQLYMARVGANISRYTGFDPNENALQLTELYGENYFVATEKIEIDCENYFVLSIMPDLFGNGTYFINNLCNTSEIISKSVQLVLKQLEDPQEDLDKYKKYISFLNVNYNKLNGCRMLINEYVRLTKHTQPERQSVCSIHAVLDYIKKSTLTRLSSLGSMLDIECCKTTACMLNFHDFSCLIINAINFAILYSGNKNVKITVVEDGEVTLVNIRINDKYDAVNLYKNLFVNDDGKLGKREDCCSLFMPLAVVNMLASQYKYRLEYIKDEDDLILSLHLKTSHSLPAAFLKSGKSAWCDSIDQICEKMLVDEDDYKRFNNCRR